MIFPEARATTPDSREQSSIPLPELTAYPYLTVFREKVRELMEKKNTQDGTNKVSRFTPEPQHFRG